MSHAGPSKLLGILQRDPCTDCDQHGRVDVRAAQLPQQAELDEPAQHHAERNSKNEGYEEIDAQKHHEGVHHIRAEGV